MAAKARGPKTVVMFSAPLERCRPRILSVTDDFLPVSEERICATPRQADTMSVQVQTLSDGCAGLYKSQNLSHVGDCRMNASSGNGALKLIIGNEMVKIWVTLLTKATLCAGVIGLIFGMAAALFLDS